MSDVAPSPYGVSMIHPLVVSGSQMWTVAPGVGLGPLVAEGVGDRVGVCVLDGEGRPVTVTVGDAEGWAVADGVGEG